MIYNKTEKTITTDRLILRLFKGTDVEEVALLCNNYNLYKYTLNLPYPYYEDHALGWIANHEKQFEEDKRYAFAITDKESGKLYGSIGISNKEKDRKGEIGYWVGEKYWGNGYATEATKAIIDFAFKEKNYHRVYGGHFKSNKASGEVMKKSGMTYEGTLKEHVFKIDSFEDIVFYGIINNISN